MEADDQVVMEAVGMDDVDTNTPRTLLEAEGIIDNVDTNTPRALLEAEDSFESSPHTGVDTNFERVATHAKLFATAFMSSPNEDGRNTKSVYNGSTGITRKNSSRHMTKQISRLKLKSLGMLANTAAQTSLALNYFESATPRTLEPQGGGKAPSPEGSVRRKKSSLLQVQIGQEATDGAELKAPSPEPSPRKSSLSQVQSEQDTVSRFSRYGRLDDQGSDGAVEVQIEQERMARKDDIEVKEEPGPRSTSAPILRSPEPMISSPSQASENDPFFLTEPSPSKMVTTSSPSQAQHLLKARSQTYAGSKLDSKSVGSLLGVKKARKKRRKSASGAGTVEVTLFKELRDMYDTRKGDDDDDDEIDNVDESLYTDLALLQREAIRLEPQVQLVISDLYEAVDSNASNTIEENEYRDLVRALYTCLRTFWDKEMPELDEAEMQAIAEDDWKVDCAGHDHINYNRFVIAMFKLCDIWTDFLDGETYLDFLLALRDRMTTLRAVDGKVRRVLRADMVFNRDAKHSERDKVLLILELYNSQLERWESHNQLGLWVSKGSNENMLRSKSPEVVSNMVIKYLEKNCAGEKQLWAKTVKACRAALRVLDLKDRKQKELARKHRASGGSQETVDMAKRNWAKVSSDYKNRQALRKSQSDFTYAIAPKNNKDLKTMQRRSITMKKKKKAVAIASEQASLEMVGGADAAEREKWLANNDLSTAEQEAISLTRSVTLKKMNDEKLERKKMEQELTIGYSDLFKAKESRRKSALASADAPADVSPSCSPTNKQRKMSSQTASPTNSQRKMSSQTASGSSLQRSRPMKEGGDPAKTAAEEAENKKAEEKAQKEAEEKAKREAEEKAKREAEEKATREMEEEAARVEAEVAAKKKAKEDKVRMVEEEDARKEAEAKAAVEAEKARIEAERVRRRAEGEVAKKRVHEEAVRQQHAEAEARRTQQDLPRYRRASAASRASDALADLRPMQRTWLEKMTALQQRLFVDLRPEHRDMFWKLEAGKTGEEHVGQRAAFLLLPAVARSQFTRAPSGVRDDIVLMPREQQFEFFRIEVPQQSRMLMFTKEQRQVIMGLPDTLNVPKVGADDMPRRVRDILGPNAVMGVSATDVSASQHRLSARRIWWSMSDTIQDACFAMTQECRLYFLTVLTEQDRAKWILLSSDERKGFWGIYRTTNPRQGKREAACSTFMETMLTLNRQVYWELGAKERQQFWDEVPAAEREVIERLQLPTDVLRLYLRSLSFTTEEERMDFLNLPVEVQNGQAGEWREEAARTEAATAQIAKEREEELAAKKMIKPLRQTSAKKIQVSLPSIPGISTSPPLASFGGSAPPLHSSPLSAPSDASVSPIKMYAGRQDTPLMPLPRAAGATGKIVPHVSNSHDEYEYPAAEMSLQVFMPDGMEEARETHHVTSAAVDRLTELDRELELEMEQQLAHQLAASRKQPFSGNAAGAPGVETVLAVAQRAGDSPLRMAQVLEETAIGTRRGESLRFLQKASELAGVRPARVLGRGRLGAMCTSGGNEVQKWKERKQHTARKGRRRMLQGKLETMQGRIKKLGHERLWQQQPDAASAGGVSVQWPLKGSRSTGRAALVKTPVLRTAYSANLDSQYLGFSMDGVNVKEARRRPETSQFPPLHLLYRSDRS
jgi:hypothetical protein